MGMGPLDGSDLGSQERMVGIKVLVYTMAFQTERSQSHALVIYKRGVFVSIYSWQISTRPAESSNHRGNAEKGSQFLDEADYKDTPTL